MKSVAGRLGVNYHTLGVWVQAAKSAAAVSTVPADLPPEQQLCELQKENARLRMERDILKKRRPTSRHWTRGHAHEVRLHQGEPRPL